MDRGPLLPVLLRISIELRSEGAPVEKQVIFRDRQEAQAGDFNAAQDFARQSLDHIVRDGILAEKAFAGFLVNPNYG